jgi:imidazolonepropionase-like amidohydrolase
MNLPRHLAIAASLVCASLITLPAQSPGGVKAFTGARVIDGTDRAPIDNATILVRGGRVVSVGPAASVTVPAGAERISLAGKHVIPGLVNAHGHVGNTVGMEQGHYSAENVLRDLHTYAAYGVTTVFSLGDDQDAGFKARDAQNTPSLDRARLFVAGPVLAPKSPDEARKLVGEVAAMKADIVKIRVDDNLGTTPKMAPEIYKAVIDEAHKKGMRMAVHIVTLADAKAVLRLGADYIAHSIRDQEVDQETIALLKKNKAFYTPTFTRELSTYIYAEKPAFLSDPFLLKDGNKAEMAKAQEPAFQETMRNDKNGMWYKEHLPMAMRNLKKVEDAGVPVVMGTDTGPPQRFQGYFEHLELEYMTKAGLTPMQALVAATGTAARCLKAADQFGTHVAMQNSNADDDSQLHPLREVPIWNW